MNNYSEFQVNIFINDRDIRLHLENFKPKKGHNFVKPDFQGERCRTCPLVGGGGGGGGGGGTGATSTSAMGQVLV